MAGLLDGAVAPSGLNRMSSQDSLISSQQVKPRLPIGRSCSEKNLFDQNSSHGAHGIGNISDRDHTPLSSSCRMSGLGNGLTGDCSPLSPLRRMSGGSARLPPGPVGVGILPGGDDSSVSPCRRTSAGSVRIPPKAVGIDNVLDDDCSPISPSRRRAGGSARLPSDGDGIGILPNGESSPMSPFRRGKGGSARLPPGSGAAGSGILPSGDRSQSACLSPGPMRTVFSEQMHAGTGVKQVLGHCPGTMQRSSSVPPMICGSLQHDDDDGSLSLRSWIELPGASEAPSTPCSLTRSASARSISSVSKPTRFTSAAWAPRRSLGSDVWVSTASEASTRSSKTMNSSWSAESLPVARLRGDGQAIGQAGRGSLGIPWRQIPVYSPKGVMTETRDAFGTGEARQRDHKLPTQFSPKLGTSKGMRDILEPVFEHKKSATLSEVAVPEEVAVSSLGKQSPRQAWIETVKRRQELKYDRYREASATLSIASSSDGSPSMHWAFRPQRKSVNIVHNTKDSCTKDSCPFSRNDSQPECRPTVPATPHRRSPRSPTSANRPVDPHVFPAERSPQNTRNSHFQQLKSSTSVQEEAAQSESISPKRSPVASCSSSTAAGGAGASASRPRAGQQTPQPWR